MTTIETDYLVVGAGAAGMAFTDALVTDSDADVVMVDRRHRPGGHWNTAYPFVRLHQPSPFYGVNARKLGNDTIDSFGPNAGFYERATASEIVGYFERVLTDDLLPTGRVRFFGLSDYDTDANAGEHRFTSRLTGEPTTVRVRRKIVDATYLETDVPSMHTPSFSVDPDARFVPVNGLVTLTEPATGYTIIGAGKTAMDACGWLLDVGIAPDAIRWVRPRDAWMLAREYSQPLALLPALIEGVSYNLECAAEAESEEDLFRRLDACGQLVRIDPSVTPTMYRCATVSERELAEMRAIENVVRRGRVLHVGARELVMEQGTLPTAPGHVYVDCSAGGLRLSPARPIFEPDRITLQQVRTCQPTFNAAVLGFLEATRGDDAQKNALCPPNAYPNAVGDWITGTRVSQTAQNAWQIDADLSVWMEGARLNAARGMGDHLHDPRMQSALHRLLGNAEPAVRNLERLEARRA